MTPMIYYDITIEKSNASADIGHVMLAAADNTAKKELSAL